MAKKIYRELGKKVLRFGDPFSTSPSGTFFAYLNEPFSPARPGARAITRLIWYIYQSRPDLQKAYPDPLGKDLPGFLTWVERSGPLEAHLEAPFILTGTADRKAEPSPVLQKHLPSLFRSKRSNGRALFGINLAGYLRGEFGIGESARTYAAAIRQAGIPHALINVETAHHRHEDPSLQDLGSDNPYRFNLIHVNADQVPFFHRDRHRRFFDDKFNIGLWFWETENFPECWNGSFRFFREIWAASSFCQKSFAARSPVPVLNIGFPVRIDEVTVPKSHLGMGEKDFLFLYYFDFLSYFERKNPLDLVEAFRLAFAGSSGVRLVIKSMNSAFAPDKMETLKKAAEGLPVLFIDRCIDRAEMIKLMNVCDAFVSLHRSEGLGLGLAQAMFLGKPVIGTGYSGNMDFMTPANSFPVPYRLVRLTDDIGPYKAGDSWAQPDIIEASRLMRSVFEDRSAALAKGRIAQQDVRARMDPKIIGEKIRERLNFLAGS